MAEEPRGQPGKEGEEAPSNPWASAPPLPHLGDAAPPNPLGPLLLGVAASNALGALLMGLARWIIATNHGSAALMVSALFLVIPLLMGIVSARFWRTLDPTTGGYFLYSLPNLAVALVLSYFFLHEGVICLIIVSPLILTFLFCGTLIGRAIFDRPGRLGASVVPVLLALLIADATARHDHHAVVTDSLRIRARPEQVWKHVAACGPIPEDSGFWLFRIGLPRPVQTKVAGRAVVGAERLCIFSGNLVFVERIAAIDPGKRLVFDIVRQPDHPEILGHARVTRGQLVLRDNGDGTTTLTGSTAYRLHVYPAWYYDWWARSVGRNVHWDVMRHIQRLAEAPDRATPALPIHDPRRAEAGARPAPGP